MPKLPRAKSGAPITDELAERIAPTRPRQVTNCRRPSASGVEWLAGARPVPAPRVIPRGPAELQAQAEARAVREGKTISQIAREALEQYVK